MNTFRVTLINMPFGDLQMPSLGLMQLKARLESVFKDRVSCRILYLSNDYARYLGLDVYTRIVASTELQVTGLGDWFFRQLAFPEEPDNERGYFRRYFNAKDDATVRLRERLRDRRPGLEAFTERLIDACDLRSADLVGLTSMFSQNVACLAMARLLKRSQPAPLVVMGGANCEAPMGKVIADHVEWLDAVFSGPALHSFPEYVEACMDGRPERIQSIEGVFTRQGRQLLARNGLLTMAQPAVPPFGKELDINTTIEPDYDEFLDQFSTHFRGEAMKPTLTFETSRGCWWGAKAHCTFCGLNGSNMTYRALDSRKAVEQFQRLFTYADRSSFFFSVDNILPTNYPTEVLPLLDAPPNVKIFYEVKADLSDKTLASLARAGVRIVQPGIEALSTSTLKLMRKGTSAFSNIAFLKGCLQHDIKPLWNLLIGFPGEQAAVYEKYQRDIPLLAHLPPPSGVFPIRFDRYSPYFTKAAEYELSLEPMEFYRLVYPFPQAAIADLAYYFVDVNPNASYMLNMAEWHGPLNHAVDRWKRRWLDGDCGAVRPVLHVTNGSEGVVVHDSRFDREAAYRLTTEQARCLHRLALPARSADLAQLSREIPTIVVERELAFLRDRRLVFEEGDRLVGLVSNAELAAPALQDLVSRAPEPLEVAAAEADVHIASFACS